jgi:aspartyl-tRNA(Asn)/glutamyl-tRNA(Gln) amidotransferase subunit A
MGRGLVEDHAAVLRAAYPHAPEDWPFRRHEPVASDLCGEDGDVRALQEAAFLLRARLPGEVPEVGVFELADEVHEGVLVVLVIQGGVQVQGYRAVGAFRAVGDHEFVSGGGALRNEICRTDAVTLSGRIRAKELSPVEVVDAVLDRMERLEPTLHAFCTRTPEMARADAERIEAQIMAGEEAGPLAGVPVGIKDLVATKGIRTAMGSHAYIDFVPEEDDVVVERLKGAGAVILGKTNVPEFGYSGVGHNPVFETTTNPWNTNLTPGGSSAGSGAAVASGMGPFAIGSDGGGSIRIPSSFCGLYGIKASMGRVPLYPGCRDERYPGVSSWESLEHIGPISRTVADSALMLSVIAGPDDRDRHTLPEASFDWLEVLQDKDLRGLRVAYSSDWGYAAIDPEVRRVVGEAVRVFERDLGCIVEEAHPGWDDPYDAFWGLVALDTDLVGMRKMAEELGDKMSPHLAWIIHERLRRLPKECAIDLALDGPMPDAAAPSSSVP